MRRFLVRQFGIALAAANALAAMPARAQIADPIPPPIDRVAVVRDWIALDATPGRERQATDAILHTNSDWKRDALGSLVMSQGSGSPVRVVACSLDQAGYVVSEITPSGYLRIQNAGNARRHPLWDQFHEGQAIRVLTRRGLVPGVIGVRSTHLQRGRVAESAPASIESFSVDVGARTAAEVDSLGIAMLDPVARDRPDLVYGLERPGSTPKRGPIPDDQRLVAGPAALARAGCAAVSNAAPMTPARGRTVFVIAAQSAFAHAGLAAVIARLGHVDSLTMVGDNALVADSAPPQRVATRSIRLPFALPAGSSVGAVSLIDAPVLYRGTLVESLNASQIGQLFFEAERAAAVTMGMDPDVNGPPRIPLAPTDTSSSAGVDQIRRVLSELADLYSVSGHEQPMRNQVRAWLPTWARAAAHVDSAGNVIIAVGPERDTALFVAHMDEIGYEITSIARDGTVHLRQRGGFFQSLWEGQPALLHVERNGAPSGPLPGVFVPRATATTRLPNELTAWFGLDSASLVAAGAGVGSAVTGVKRALRLAGTRFAARSVDDRAGCAAMLVAMQSLDPAKLTHKLIFVFSVREETGLQGASAVAAQLGRAVHRVYAVDTFVSSDYPGESTRFADLPIGDGAIVRALDNSSSTPPDEIDRVLGVAKAAAVPIQVGTTNGGNDGSAFVPYGAVDIPLSWPARYSHSPVELIDLRDVEALARLIAAMAIR